MQPIRCFAELIIAVKICVKHFVYDLYLILCVAVITMETVKQNILLMDDCNLLNNILKKTAVTKKVSYNYVSINYDVTV